MKPSETKFLRFVSFTLIALYALILIGGLVRATGSGMGCPDWPKCFGKLVPPTSVEQLPDNYLEQYVAKRKVKNERIANFIQAFLGSIVVSTNLIPATITIHMLFSLLMVGALVYCIVKVRANQFVGAFNHWDLNKVVWFNLIIGLTQIVLGTQVRENVDVLKANPVETYTIMERLLAMSHDLELHRLLSFGVVIATIVLFMKLSAVESHSIVKFAVNLSVVIVGLSMLTGIILYSYDIPAFAQPIHLTLGTLLTGAHLLILMVIWHSPKAVPANIS